MKYYLFKLRFLTAVHFGNSLSAVSLADSDMTFCADRLFSALCQTMLGENADWPQRLCDCARSGGLVLSDGMPWKGEEYYLPRPCLEASVARTADPADRKAMKKLAYLPLTQYDAYLNSLRGGKPIDPNALITEFGRSATAIRGLMQDGEDALPYAVGQFRFRDDCGLYFLLGLEDASLFPTLVRAIRRLGQGGIGGKISSGYGSFTVEKACTVSELDKPTAALWNQYLMASHANTWISLTACLPRDEELEDALEGALFQLIRRGGFVQGAGADGQKKQEQFFLAAGAAFRHRFAGDVYDVAPPGSPHPVYRYGMPLFLGVS